MHRARYNFPQLSKYKSVQINFGRIFLVRGRGHRGERGPPPPHGGLPLRRGRGGRGVPHLVGALRERLRPEAAAGERNMS